jgi:hypothetical protein
MSSRFNLQWNLEFMKEHVIKQIGDLEKMSERVKAFGW